MRSRLGHQLALASTAEASSCPRIQASIDATEYRTARPTFTHGNGPRGTVMLYNVFRQTDSDSAASSAVKSSFVTPVVAVLIGAPSYRAFAWPSLPQKRATAV
jgi:hypothetical protein